MSQPQIQVWATTYTTTYTSVGETTYIHIYKCGPHIQVWAKAYVYCTDNTLNHYVTLNVYLMLASKKPTVHEIS